MIVARPKDKHDSRYLLGFKPINIDYNSVEFKGKTEEEILKDYQKNNKFWDYKIETEPLRAVPRVKLADLPMEDLKPGVMIPVDEYSPEKREWIPPRITEIAVAGISSSIENTLKERGSRYGNFEEHARLTQMLKEVMHSSKNWPKLPLDMKESLEMVMHKIGRILNGDPYYQDSWTDIIGYVKLVEQTLNDNNRSSIQAGETSA